MEKPKIMGILSKARYIIEFVLMFFFSICLYYLITMIAYEFYLPKSLLAVTLLLGSLCIANIIYNCKKDKEKIENMFINFAIPVGILFIVFMIPTFTPDASAHIFKAYEVSEGILFTKIDEKGESKTLVPVALAENAEFPEYANYLRLMKIKNLENIRNYQQLESVDSSAENYSFILYLGYAIGFWIARILNINIFLGIYLARVINFIIILILGYWSVKLIPFGKLLLIVYWMIPMMMQQFTAVSADSMINGGLILFIAYALYLAFKEEKLTKKEIEFFLVLTAFVGISKLTYVPLLGLGIIIVKRRKDMPVKQKFFLGILAIIICFFSAGIFMISTMKYSNETATEYAEMAGVNPGEQIHQIISNPVHLIKVIINDFIKNGKFYVASGIGDYLGWLFIRVPKIDVIVYILLLLLAVLVEKNPKIFDIPERLIMIFLFGMMIVLVLLGLYIEWTPVGYPFVMGVQGRYFLPTGILVLLALCRKENGIHFPYANIVIPMLSLWTNIIFIKNMIVFFL